ncbi:hypothetical protein LNP74_04990 [Klebsiella pneumoniae subsp. pneumoniae]|nr:hypothetical protein [Klebsiella pneumoniae subsp. pneumoniae]
MPRHFTPYHWVDALLAGKEARVVRPAAVTPEGREPAILLRTLQRELLLAGCAQAPRRRTRRCARRLINTGLAKPPPAAQRRPHAPEREQLRQAVTLLTRAELTFKQDGGHDVWPELKVFVVALPQSPGGRFY